MKFDSRASTNPIDQLKVVGQPVNRVDGPLKTTGSAPYAYERHEVAPNQAYGYVIASAIAKGRIKSMDLEPARRAPGVLAVVTAETAGTLGKGKFNTAKLLAGPQIDHYHQALGVILNSPPVSYMGPNPRAFGTAGSGGSFGLADRDAKMSFGYAQNAHIGTSHDSTSRSGRLIQAVYDSL